MYVVELFVTFSAMSRLHQQCSCILLIIALHKVSTMMTWPQSVAISIFVDALYCPFWACQW